MCKGLPQVEIFDQLWTVESAMHYVQLAAESAFVAATHCKLRDIQALQLDYPDFFANLPSNMLLSSVQEQQSCSVKGAPLSTTACMSTGSA